MSKPSTSQSFENYLYWPQQKLASKRKIRQPKEKLTSILSSEEARKWYTEKKEQKERLENEKEARKVARLEKSKINKELKEKRQQKSVKN